MKYKEAIQYLQETDPQLKQLIEQIGDCRWADDPPQSNLLSALVWAIIAQQISTVAANKIYEKFIFYYAAQEPLQVNTLLAITEGEYRKMGIPRYKILYLQNLAQYFSQDIAHLDKLEEMNDETVIKTLSKVKGIGVWTAQMILIFWLRRLDVLPSGDLGIRRAVQQLYDLEKMPSPQTVTSIGEQWKPYRTIATWYLWRSLSDSILSINF